MKQKTIAKPVEIKGIGLHSGKCIKLRLEPLGENSGIIFYRKDKGITIPLDPNNVVNTQLATVIGKDGINISTIEHLLSALYAFGIDNLRIIIDGDEIPILDGSAIGFVMLINEAGIQKLNADKIIAVITKSVEVKKDDKFVRLEPYDGIMYDYTIYFDHPVIGKQQYIFNYSLHDYINEISKARTFGFLKEVQYLKSIGLIQGGNIGNAIVLDENKILNDNLRYPDEFVRHKILDAIGDLSLLNFFYVGKYTAYKGSHELNNLLVKKVIEENTFEFIKLNKNKNIERIVHATAI